MENLKSELKSEISSLLDYVHPKVIANLNHAADTYITAVELEIQNLKTLLRAEKTLSDDLLNRNQLLDTSNKEMASELHNINAK